MKIHENRRIVSLVPSLSETIAVLGLQNQLVGCTSFCTQPRALQQSAQIIGGTKNADPRKIRALQPTHLLANQEENPKDLVLSLAKDIPTLVSFPKGPADVAPMLREMGEFLEIKPLVETWALAIEQQLQQKIGFQAINFLYLIWKDPYMLAGPDTYISKTLEWLGWQNAYQGTERYPVISPDNIDHLEPELILLSSEPFPFRIRDAKILQGQCSKQLNLAKIDGQLLSWYGTRTLTALQLLCGDQKKWLQPINLP